MVTQSPKLTTSAISIAAVILIAAGCGGGNKLTKQGEAISRQITLKMETPDAPQRDAEFFARRVAALTHERVHVEEAHDYSSGHPENEARLAAALREGKVQMAYIPSRAWERDGGRVLAFRALQAPFLITSYPLLRAVSSGVVGRELLATLSRNGLVGLGLVSDEMRRLLARRPLLSPSDLRGARIRVTTSPTSVRMFQALGSVPVTSLVAEQVGPALASGQLDGVESSSQIIANNGYVNQARYLTSNVALFPKTQTLVITRHTFDHLSAADRLALQQAAEETVAHADPGAAERTEIQSLCVGGLRTAHATAAALTALRHETKPVYAELERDPTTRQAIVAIQRLSQQVQGSDNSLPTCQPGSHTTASSRQGRTGSFPTGTFETILTRADVVKAGFLPENAHWETLTFRENGTWLDQWFHPRRADQGPFGGKYTVHGDTLTFGTRDGSDVVKWSYFRGQLTLRIKSVPDPFGQYTYTAHPWRKIG